MTIHFRTTEYLSLPEIPPISISRIDLFFIAAFLDTE